MFLQIRVNKKNFLSWLPAGMAIQTRNLESGIRVFSISYQESESTILLLILVINPKSGIPNFYCRFLIQYTQLEEKFSKI